MKLQRKLVILIIPVIVVPLMVLGWNAYQQLRSTTQQRTFGQMSSLINQTEFFLNSYVETAKSNIDLFAGSSLIKRYLRTDDEVERYTLVRPTLLRLFASYQSAYPHYYDLRIILPDGKEDTRSTPNPSAITGEWDAVFFVNMSLSKKDIFTTYFHNSENGEFSLFVSKRINLIDQYLDSNQAIPRLRGYLTIKADLKVLRQQLVKERVGENGSIFLTDKEGRIVIHPDPEKQGQLVPADLFKNLQQLTLSGGYIKGNYDNQKFFFQGKQVDDNLFVFTALPEIEIHDASRKLGIMVTSILLITVLITSTLLFIALKFLIIMPIHDLKEAVKEISKGRLGVFIDITSNDEIGELAS